ncbi:uncharacterized protein LOC113473949 [Diaphorina citri]|uniref:Uncharacterized protein LOC113473949 n=1 Tax=Diaphorina citri TaxID=121845 RepID=A0A3Q0JLS8_DIACI|nr:uncharacterized protein LOC113473949 [Diaphorina citri]
MHIAHGQVKYHNTILWLILKTLSTPISSSYHHTTTWSHRSTPSYSIITSQKICKLSNSLTDTSTQKCYIKPFAFAMVDNLIRTREHSSPTNNDLGKEACRRELVALLDSAATAEDMAIIKKGIGQIKATLTAVRSQNQLPAAKSNGREIFLLSGAFTQLRNKDQIKEELKKPSVAESDDISTNLILSLL